MKQVTIFGLVILAMWLTFFLNRRLNGWIQPRRSVGRLVIYIGLGLICAFAITFLTVFSIVRLFPGELIK